MKQASTIAGARLHVFLIGKDAGRAAARSHLLERFAGVDRVVLLRAAELGGLRAEAPGVLVISDAVTVNPEVRRNLERDGWTVLTTPEIAGGPLALFPAGFVREFAEVVAKHRAAGWRVRQPPAIQRMEHSPQGAATQREPGSRGGDGAARGARLREADPSACIELLALGASTGGPEVLARFLKRIAPDFPVPMVITQHMGAQWLASFAELLARTTQHNVLLATDGAALRPGVRLLAPGDQHLIVERSGGVLCTRLSSAPAENWCRPAVDPMFRSVAQVCGARAMGIVFTGMGADGAVGAQALESRGATVMVQDEASSAVWGMPGSVVRAGVQAIVLPPEGLADLAVNLCTVGA